MLQLENVHVSYGPIKAVRGVSLEVKGGEIVALLGPNGAGKTSLVSSVVGLAPTSAGKIRLDGADITGEPTERIVTRGITLTPEGRRVFADLTVGENLQLGAACRKDRDGVAEDLETYLELFPILRKRYAARARMLSGGEQQMLAIARSLMSRPKMLMLDEPSLGLAPRVVDQIFELLHGLRSKGLTMLLVEQNANEALDLADSAYVIASGSLVFGGKAADLKASGEVMEMYLGLEGH
ncbi:MULTISPECIES: ABC transporter ATP-binding protein [Hyphomicrobium]|jgi:branched-chain amino acid transport system ATP-binding protein|uniref:ABC transporter ATP-binding protein n=1 Tax=Hyphomicrobium TaxID=81 RepID=UPI0003812E7F|nr:MULTISPECIES: ABC transporter ATP-binding protein [Hyphomicrobium]WBT38451.1 ABC transporter ATP-binding protein [Hyphomicrobium sp. DMF-1]HML41782.1 ABC transporter ATP-binding protein [Hyphomicrobium zavarzinii]